MQVIEGTKLHALKKLLKWILMCNKEETWVLPLEVKECRITIKPFVPELNDLCILKKMGI
jgi:hypothetical protein